MTETQERFLRAVLSRVPLDTVVELHLFPPIRRGTMETGVAVIATVLPPPPLAVVPESTDVEPEAEEASEVVEILEVVEEEAAGNAVAISEISEVVESSEVVEGEASGDTVVISEVVEILEVVEGEASGEAVVISEVDELVEVIDGEVSDEAVAIVEIEETVAITASIELPDAVAASETVDATDVAEQLEATDAADVSESSDATEVTESDESFTVIDEVPAPAQRTRILTAAYRHTIKGIDRGKWTVDVQEEADAPLAAVELVLRGVRHRSAEAADPELVSLGALAALLEPARVAPAA